MVLPAHSRWIRCEGVRFCFVPIDIPRLYESYFRPYYRRQHQSVQDDLLFSLQYLHRRDYCFDYLCLACSSLNSNIHEKQVALGSVVRVVFPGQGSLKNLLRYQTPSDLEEVHSHWRPVLRVISRIKSAFSIPSPDVKAGCNSAPCR